MKHIIFHDLNANLISALSAHLNGFKISESLPPPDQPPADLIVSHQTGGTHWPGLASVHIALTSPRRPRLGEILSDIARALTDPAFAVVPFMIGTDVFYPAEKKLRRTLPDATAQDIILTERETLLLLCLARHAPRAVSRDTLLREVWQYQDGIDTHTLETHIYRLRQKIEVDVSAPTLLMTRAEGYLLGTLSAASPDE